ncbi:family 2 glycosyl transferase [Salinisphaera sp. C84B14]|uniref:glycosyltransferase family 2 protein n=1 Tax=Salinisphaera sp. C84B14 TaxID=1304155 RepID=UPI00333F28F3
MTPSAQPGASTPDEIAVVIATANRASSLDRTLSSLSKVDPGGLAWRVIVVDNASADETPEVLSDWQRASRLPLQALHEPQPGKTRALNRALNTIDHGLVIFVDDDVELPVNWLKAYAAGVQRWPSADIFGGRITPHFPPDAPAWVRDQRYVHQSAMFSKYEPLEEEGLTQAWPLGPNMAIRRELIGDVRFDTRLGPGGEYGVMGDETAFVSRLVAEKQAQIVYLPEAAASHYVRDEQLSRDAIWARAFWWGRTRGVVAAMEARRACIAGAPLAVWTAAARSGLRFAFAHVLGRSAYLKTGWQWQVRFGRVCGYREYTRRARAAS